MRTVTYKMLPVVIPNVAVRSYLEHHSKVEMLVPDRTSSIYVDEQPTDNPIENNGQPRKGGGGGGLLGQVVPSGVHRIGADPLTLPFTGIGVGVAVADTGVDLDHPDLIPQATCYKVTDLLDCSTGQPVSFASCDDDHGHGTHVAGTIAARDNSIGTVGVASGANIYSVKVVDQTGHACDSWIIDGLNWIARNANSVSPPIRVVNMSLGRSGTLNDNPAFRFAVQYLYNMGISVTAAAGNSDSVEVTSIVPAGYPEVMAVASTTVNSGTNDGSSKCGQIFQGFPIIQGDTASFFTTDGRFDPATRRGVTISAPGDNREDVVGSDTECFLVTRGLLSLWPGGGTEEASGTSMATPLVSGVLALMWAKALFAGGTLAPEDARAKIRSSADRINVAPLDNLSLIYTFDGEREGVLSAPGALQ